VSLDGVRLGSALLVRHCRHRGDIHCHVAGKSQRPVRIDAGDK
jgi:hypothetical protein